MTESRPEENIEDLAQSSGDSGGQTAPDFIIDEDASLSDGGGGGDFSIPSGGPDDDESASTDDGFGSTTVWHVNKKVSGLWCINQNRNTWIALQGVSGWKKLSPANDSGVVALNIAVSNARASNRNVKAKEVDGKITQIYVW